MYFLTDFNLLWIIAFLLYVYICLIYTSMFEWLLHRYVMHRPFLGFVYAYKTHAIVHHVEMKANASYQATNENKDKIPMAWWNGPILIAIAALLPGIPIALAIIHGVWLPVVVLVSILALYFIVYETTHWWMHNRKERLLFKIPFIKHWFYKLNWHHLLHHRHQGNNFNVVWPFADKMLGTYIAKSSDPLFKAPKDGQFPEEFK